MGSSSYGERIYWLLRILEEYTDETHALNTQKILQLLSEKEIDVSERMIRTDLEALQRVMPELRMTRKGYNQYQMIGNLLAREELKAIIDLIVNARAIPVERSKQMVHKLKRTVSMHTFKTLTEGINYRAVSKSKDEGILMHLDKLHEAINSGKQVKFTYFQWNWNKVRVKKRDFEYQVQPCGIVLEDGNWYLLGVSQHRLQRISPFRIDRIGELGITGLPIETNNEAVKQFKVENYTKYTFDMFPAESLTWVKLAFHKDLATVVYDKFGMIAIQSALPDREDFFAVEVEVGITKTFISFLLTFEDQVEVLEPESLRHEMQRFVANVYRIYGQEEDN